MWGINLVEPLISDRLEVWAIGIEVFEGTEARALRFPLYFVYN